MREAAPGFWVPDGVVSEPMTRPDYNGELVARCAADCPSRDLVVDGGAYVGTFSMHAVARFTRVIAFEPAPDNFECLLANAGAQVACRQACLAAASGRDRMAPHERAKTHGWRRHEDGELEVDAVALDDLALGGLSLLKLDLEGGEYDALRGSLRTLVRHRPAVLIEEKVDPDRRSSRLLEALGMHEVWRMKHDVFFTWH